MQVCSWAFFSQRCLLRRIPGVGKEVPGSLHVKSIDKVITGKVTDENTGVGLSGASI
jgi:hypothetical protein